MKKTKSYQNADDEKIQKIVDDIILEIKSEISDKKFNSSEEIESALSYALNHDPTQNANQHENNVRSAPPDPDQFSIFLDSLNLYQNLYNAYDANRLKDSKKIFKNST